MSLKKGLYVTGGTNGSIYAMDNVTGSVSLLLTSNYALADIAFYQDNLYAITASQLLTIEPDTGSCVVVGGLGFVDSAAKLAIASDGKIYCIATPSDSGTGLYSINSSTGAGTLIGTLASAPASVAIPSHGMAFDTNDNLFDTMPGYNINGQESLSLVPVNLSTGLAQPINNNIGFNSLCGITFYAGALYGVTADGTLITINAATGTGSLIGNHNTQNLDLHGMTAYC